MRKGKKNIVRKAKKGSYGELSSPKCIQHATGHLCFGLYVQIRFTSLKNNCKFWFVKDPLECIDFDTQIMNMKVSKILLTTDLTTVSRE